MAPLIRNLACRAGLVAAGLALGCGPGPSARSPGDGGLPEPCSQLHRAMSRWQGNATEYAQCGPDVTGLLELTPIGYHQIIARRRFSSLYDLWSVSATGALADAPTPVAPAGGLTAGYAFLPGSTPHMLLYDPTRADWSLFATARSTPPGGGWLVSLQSGQWPAGSFHSGRPGTAGHQLLGLDDGHVLDRDLGDGSTRVWQVVTAGSGPVNLELVNGLAGGPRQELRRGHRLVAVGGGRLLEWLPRPCPAVSTAATGGACSGADYRVWRYALDASAARDPLDPEPTFSGSRSDVGAGEDIFADDATLYVWTRAQGRLRSVPLDPTAADPFPPEIRPWPGDVTRPELVSRDWDPPTASPAIKHLVLILQNGRSFDAYFGQYCQSDAASMSGASQQECGPSCCEAMPASIPGAAACAPIGSLSDGHVPISDPECMRSKIAGGDMSRFALGPPQGTCGDPLDFACAGPDSNPGTPADYWRLAATGALADNFFQSYAYADPPGTPGVSNRVAQNLLYLEAARFVDSYLLENTPLLTKALALVQVPWAIYGGPSNLVQMSILGVPQFYDPDWYPYRALASELDRDLENGQLPSVTVVFPDDADPATSESPGHPVGPAIEFVTHLKDEILASPLYRDNTLVLLTYLTAGGYYDHVAPPSPLALDVDGSSSDPTKAGLVYYGPRVPLLAFPPFGRRNQISHVQLELTSINLFIEWNWRRGNTLKGYLEGDDRRRYRDTVVNNIGSLIDPDAARIEVPSSHD